jgi:hypothetical protein
MIRRVALVQGVTSQKTPFFIVTAVKTSSLTDLSVQAIARLCNFGMYIYAEITLYCMPVLPSFMKISNDVERMLKYILINSRGCNICFTDESGILNVSLKWSRVE